MCGLCGFIPSRNQVSVAERIGEVQRIFREVQDSGPSLETNDLQVKYQGPFLSVAYEARAAQLARKDLQQGSASLPSWTLFANLHQQLHASQLHVGLGWALAETDVQDPSFLNTFPPDLAWRVFDGFGYYSGLFRRRETVRQQQYPPYFHDEGKAGFDQGLGRSFWYLASGDAERVQELVRILPQERHRHLWRGVGLAMSYVGGIDASGIQKVLQNAGNHASAVRCGALLALEGRKKSNTTDAFSETIAQTLQLPENPEWMENPLFSETLLHMDAQLVISG